MLSLQFFLFFKTKTTYHYNYFAVFKIKKWTEWYEFLFVLGIIFFFKSKELIYTRTIKKILTL